MVSLTWNSNRVEVSALMKMRKCFNVTFLCKALSGQVLQCGSGWIGLQWTHSVIKDIAGRERKTILAGMTKVRQVGK